MKKAYSTQFRDALTQRVFAELWNCEESSWVYVMCPPRSPWLGAEAEWNDKVNSKSRTKLMTSRQRGCLGYV